VECHPRERRRPARALESGKARSVMSDNGITTRQLRT
jgi:hypothetical protein